MGAKTEAVKITENKRKLIDAVKSHATANYEVDGWDAVVECYSDQDILVVIGESYTPQGAIAKVKKYIAPYAAYRFEVQSA